MQTTTTASGPALRHYGPAVAVAGLSALLAVGGAALLGLPLRDPDGVAGPAWLRLPGIVLLFLAADVLPTALRGAREAGGFAASYRAAVRARWSRERLTLVAVGLASFYVTYVGYRNLKGFLPFVREGTVDGALLVLDRATTLGVDPSTVLHTVLGTGAAAYLLSAVYLLFLAFVPLSLAASLVWSRDATRGAWYVTALCLNWLLGAASYYLLPSLGPVYARPGLFSDLPETGVSRLQQSLLETRVEVLADPWGTAAVHGIGAFASLHVSIVLTGALVAHLMGLHRVVRTGMWAFFGLTVLATLYFGWHYVLDDIAGVGIGVLSVWVAAKMTGQEASATRLSAWVRSVTPVGAAR
ncbi:MAG: phosphatase PAP2 family protein [Actinomycetota bacterium]|nr:phosphatase PAP2 family protein [Actinomycetota bacterium]